MTTFYWGHFVPLILFQKFPILYQASHNKPFLITAQRKAGGKEVAGAEIGEKGILQKWNEPLKLILSTYLPFILGSHFSLLQREEGRNGGGWK